MPQLVGFRPHRASRLKSHKAKIAVLAAALAVLLVASLAFGHTPVSVPPSVHRPPWRPTPPTNEVITDAPADGNNVREEAPGQLGDSSPRRRVEFWKRGSTHADDLARLISAAVNGALRHGDTPSSVWWSPDASSPSAAFAALSMDGEGVEADTTRNNQGDRADATRTREPMTEEEHHRWEAKENRLFCSEQQRRAWRRIRDTMPPPFVEKLTSMRRRHAAVARGHPEPGQKYIVWSLSGGVGNRLQSLTSAFVAALISDRVLLMKDWFTPLPHHSVKQTPVVLPSPFTSEYFLENIDSTTLFGDLAGPGADEDAADEAALIAAAAATSRSVQQHDHRHGYAETQQRHRQGTPRLANSSFSSNRRLLVDDNGARKPGPRARNNALLCPLLPAMSLTTFRRMYPADFGPAMKSKRSQDQEGGNTDETDKESSKMKKQAVRAEHAKIDISARHDKKLVRWARFLCANMSHPNERASAGQGKPKKSNQGTTSSFFPETFVYVWTNQYYLPALFANPHHAAELKAMFPRSNPYQTMLGLMVLPARPVVRHMVSFFLAQALAEINATTKASRPAGAADSNEGRPKKLQQFMHPSRPFVAAHVRAFQIPAIVGLGKRFDACLSEHRSAKALSREDRHVQMSSLFGRSSGRSNSKSKPHRTHEEEHRVVTARPSWFLATLHKEVRQIFTGHPDSNAQVLAPARHEQETGVADGDQEALADALILSLGKVLLVSPGSTYGAFAAAFGGIDDVVAVMPDGRCHAVPPAQREPCFGSWFQRDKIAHRRKELPCTLAELPPGVLQCNV